MVNPLLYHSLNWLSGEDDDAHDVAGATILYPTGNSSWVDQHYPDLAAQIHQAQQAVEAGEPSLADAFNARAATLTSEQGSELWWASLERLRAVNELPPPPDPAVPHQFDSLPVGTLIEKTAMGWGITHPNGDRIEHHEGGFNAFVHKILHWFGL